MSTRSATGQSAGARPDLRSMHVTSPRQMPDFRLWLLDQWRPEGTFGQNAAFNTAMKPETVMNGTTVVNVDPNTERTSLPLAALWWVTDQMSHLIDHASRTLPPTTLTDELCPDDHGLVVFADRLHGTTADTGEPLLVKALSWAFGRSRATGVEEIAVTSYYWLEPGELMTEALLREDVGPDEHVIELADVLVDGRPRQMALVRRPTTRGLWVVGGLSNWEKGTDTSAVPFAGYTGSETAMASIEEDRRWLAALWLMAGLPVAETTIEPADRSTRKRSERSGAGSDVRLVGVRPRPTSSSTKGEGGERNYSHRWIVGGDTGGFWRQQACGPGYSQHRPIWIEPYIAGPEDKPLHVKETVKILKEDPT